MRFSLFALLGLIWAAAAGAAEVPRFALEPGLELHYAVKYGNWFDGKDGKPTIPREADGSPKYEKFDTTIFVLAKQPDGGFRVLMHTKSGGGYPLITWADLFPDGRLHLLPAAMPVLEFDSLRTLFPLLPKGAAER